MKVHYHAREKVKVESGCMYFRKFPRRDVMFEFPMTTGDDDQAVNVVQVPFSSFAVCLSLCLFLVRQLA